MFMLSKKSRVLLTIFVVDLLTLFFSFPESLGALNLLFVAPMLGVILLTSLVNDIKKTNGDFLDNLISVILLTIIIFSLISIAIVFNVDVAETSELQPDSIGLAGLVRVIIFFVYVIAIFLSLLINIISIFINKNRIYDEPSSAPKNWILFVVSLLVLLPLFYSYLIAVAAPSLIM
jgi:hypothetical protein